MSRPTKLISSALAKISEAVRIGLVSLVISMPPYLLRIYSNKYQILLL
jgi:hypothetical protein